MDDDPRMVFSWRSGRIESQHNEIERYAESAVADSAPLISDVGCLKKQPEEKVLTLCFMRETMVT